MIESSPQKTSRGKPTNNLELADSLCAVSTALSEVRRTHVKSFGTLIPHVFMGNVLAHVGTCVLAGSGKPSRQRAEIAGILELLERG